MLVLYEGINTDICETMGKLRAQIIKDGNDSGNGASGTERAFQVPLDMRSTWPCYVDGIPAST